MHIVYSNYTTCLINNNNDKETKYEVQKDESFLQLSFWIYLEFFFWQVAQILAVLCSYDLITHFQRYDTFFSILVKDELRKFWKERICFALVKPMFQNKKTRKFHDNSHISQHS